MKTIITGILLITLLSLNAQSSVAERLQYNKDTIKCLMLVSDTARMYNVYKANGDLYGYNFGEDSPIPENCKKEFIGYQSPNPVNMVGYFYYTDKIHVNYLDGRKKPLRKTMIVWMAKEIK